MAVTEQLDLDVAARLRSTSTSNSIRTSRGSFLRSHSGWLWAPLADSAPVDEPVAVRRSPCSSGRARRARSSRQNCVGDRRGILDLAGAQEERDRQPAAHRKPKVFDRLRSWPISSGISLSEGPPRVASVEGTLSLVRLVGPPRAPAAAPAPAAASARAPTTDPAPAACGPRIVVFDCETTGTDSRRDQVIELCVQHGPRR